MALTRLDGSLQEYYTAGLAESTRKVYLTGKKQYILFCKKFNISKALPITEEMLCYYVAFLGDRGLAHSTIKTYLGALRDLHVEYGFQSPLERSMTRFDRVLKGIKVKRGREGKGPTSQ